MFRRLLVVILALGGLAPLGAGTVSSGRLEMIVDTGELLVARISDAEAGITWQSEAAAVLQGTGLDQPAIRAALAVETRADGEVALTATITNQGEEPAAVAPAFPSLEGLAVNGVGGSLEYCFPGRPAVIGGRAGRREGWYGGSFPLQFLSLYRPGGGGLFIRIEDTANQPKMFVLDLDAMAAMRVDYPSRILAPGESWTLPRVVIGVHDGDWHEAFTAYRGWLRRTCRPAAPRKEWLREAFSFRTQFLHFKQPRPSGMFDPASRRLSIADVVDRDKEAFGGIDYLHLFDWAWTPEHGRVGDYRPWDHLGGLAAFRRELAAVRAGGVRAGLYLEGYLVSTASQLGRRRGSDWEMHDAAGQPLRRWGDYHHLCPHVPEWRARLADTCRRVVQETGVDGIYVDQCGFANQYVCHRADHGHPVPSGNLTGEAALLEEVRKAVPERVALLIEETPTDMLQQQVDGSFTAAVVQGLARRPECLINLARFANPGFKSFELISEQGLRNNLDAVHVSFFNGQGLYLAGLADAWYSPECRALIGKSHGLLRRFRRAFCGLRPTPLVPVLQPPLLANHFPADDRDVDGEVWTLFNPGAEPVEGDLLAVPHLPGAVYRDLWSGGAVEVRTAGDEDRLRFRVGGRSAGCIWRGPVTAAGPAVSDGQE